MLRIVLGLLQGAGHFRTTSLDTSASNFLQSLQLHDVQALQAHMVDAQAAVGQQPDGMQLAPTASHPYTAAAAVGGDSSWHTQAEGAAATAGSKRAHSSNGRVGKDPMQEGKKDTLHQHKHSFTPALPAVEEAAAEDGRGPSDRCA